MACNLLVSALTLVMNCMLANILLGKLKMAIVLNMTIDNEFSIYILSLSSNFIILEAEDVKFHFILSTILGVMTLPFTLLVDMESSIG